MVEKENGNAASVTDKASAEYWRHLFEERKQSGKTVREYCEAEGVGYSLYYRWAQRLGYFKRGAGAARKASKSADKRGKGQERPKPGKFVELTTPRGADLHSSAACGAREAQWDAEVVFPNGAILRASASVSVERFSSLIGVLVQPKLEGVGKC